MPSSKYRLSLKASKRNLFVIFLMAISIGGCASSKKGRSSFARRDTNHRSAPGGGDSDSWEEVLVETPPLSISTKIRQVGFGDEITQEESDSPQTEQSDDPVVENELPSPADIAPDESSENAQSVDYFIGLALAQHPSIQAARQRVSAEANRIPQVRALPDPKFNNTFWPIHDQACRLRPAGLGIRCLYHRSSLGQKSCERKQPS